MIDKLDPTADHLLTQEVARVAEEIRLRYNNLKLLVIPERARETENEKNYPYAIWDENAQVIIKKFSHSTVFTALDWLWENDSQRIDTYAAFQNLVAKEKKERDDKRKAELREKMEVAAFLGWGTKKHTPKHNGVKFDADYKADKKGVVGDAS